jgi:hypothetical protein
MMKFVNARAAGLMVFPLTNIVLTPASRSPSRTLRESRGTSCPSREGLIADLAAERGLEVSVGKNVGFECHAAPRYGITPRGDRQ